MSYKFSKRLFIICWIIGFGWMLTACRQQNAPARAVSSPTPQPSPVSTPLCRPVPQMTAEKILPATIEATPAAQAKPGEDVTIFFSEGYVIMNNQIVCGEKVVAEYAYSDEIYPDYSWERQVVIRFNNQWLDPIVCQQNCQVDVTIPVDTLPGTYQLELRTGYEIFKYELDVTN